MTSVGEMLKNERVKKGLTLKQVEKEMRVREKFLEAVENNEWDIFSSRIYVTGLIKNYSKYLGLDSQRTIAFFRRDYEKKDDVHFKKRVSSRYFSSPTKRLLGMSIVFVTFVFLLYFSYQLTQYFAPPKVTILSPTASTFRATDNIKITGKTEKEASITIYGEKVFPNKDGIFEYTFPLHKGSNDLIIEVIGANGKKTVLRKAYIKE